MKQFRVLSLLTIFCLLSVGCFAISMMGYQENYSHFNQANATGEQSKLTPAEQREYTTQMNLIYLKNQLI